MPALRFDQMWQYVDANQLSPRLSFTYKPFENTTFHAGYARYFTPPVLVEAAPANIALVQRHDRRAVEPVGNDPVLPERSHYFDAGVDQKIPFGCYYRAANDCATLDLGLDAYYKIAKDLIDNGHFGQALVLSAFNYAQGLSSRASSSAPNTTTAISRPMAISPSARRKPPTSVSNQFLFDNTTPLADLGGLTEFQYLDVALDLHRSHPDRDRLGWRGLSILRPASSPGERWWDTCAGRKSRPT